MKNFIINLAKKAGREIQHNFNHDRIVKVKAKSQIVTRADLISEKIIIPALRKKFPSHGILSEESGLVKKNSDYLWAVDPLDGTTNYFIGSPIFAVQIALFYKNNPILAVAYAPAMNELYLAQKNKGTFLNNKKIRVSKNNTLTSSFLTFCHGSTKPAIKRAVKIYNKIKFNSLDSRQLGSAAIELGFVAAGRTECIIIPGANVYDVGPGALFVREAGGQVTDFFGRLWNLNSKDMVASNGRIHGQLIKFLKNI
jgi:myo-inositol-1(or 4)-monophosphatase